MRRFFRNVSIYLIVLISIMYMIKIWDNKPGNIEDFTITAMVESIEKGEVSEIVMEGREIIGKKSTGGENEYFRVYVPEIMTNTFYDNYLKEKVDSKEIRLVAKEEPGPSFLASMLPTIITILVLGAIWYMFMQQTQGGGNKMMSFGKSKAKKMQPENGRKITFDQVAGLEEEKEELGEIVDFLKTPKKYIDIGARIPKGVLLVGPPGTGKTYLSRAVSGEADVPFFTISGSDFVEMFVGVGASRVRDLFEEAKKNAPCIIFIDEIDAVGRRRGAGLGGGHDEREQTLNQLLVEMDGFEKNEGVIVMAATNRADILDPAILRPGRFDRTIYVGHPDVRGREAILEVHTRNKPLAEDVDLEIIARSTPGFTPADLENLVNEAAILSARHNLKEIPMEIVKEASIKVQAGPEKKSQLVSEEERKLTAYHEAGHAIASRGTPGSDPVNMITIVPRGGAGGFTAYLPEDRSYMTKKMMQGELVSLLGGRAAEELVLDDISTGASNDLERATKLARKMVKTYGMSDKLGVMTYEDDGNGDVFVGMDIGSTKGYSEEIASEIDKEIRYFIDKAYEDSKKVLTDNMDALHRVAKALLDKETIHGPEFEALFLGEEFIEEEDKEVELVKNDQELEEETSKE